ncbi:MAG: adenine-specific DNA-methyltransferase [Candidatus Petromonas sp.]|nr:adenine-specific DNA-methyltransferase [Candidatus Petromonas sp.]
MDKLKMRSKDMNQENIEKIAKLFPNVITEIKDEKGNITKAIDFELLQQELSDVIVEGSKERYQLTWPGKKEAIVTANTPINKTLRPVKEDSLDWETTENLYIEGDNLEVLKLLQESYLNKIKCIYIDPPYNTGKDFIYKDNFTQDKEEYLEESGQVDEYGNRLFQNTEYNGRYHSDWLSMMYPRLKLARNLLSDDGVIFISIDDNEVHNLRKICDEIFGEENFVGDIIRKTKSSTNDPNLNYNMQHDNILVYMKSDKFTFVGLPKDLSRYTNPDNDPNGAWVSSDPSAKSGGSGTYFKIVNPYTKKVDLPPQGRFWAFNKDTYNRYLESGKIVFKKEHGLNERGFIFKTYLNQLKNKTKPMDSLLFVSNDYMNQNATKELNDLNVDFAYPKPIKLIKDLLKYSISRDSVILDFFSGSATTAHAVMQLNAEDGGNRKYIMVQLPEPTDEKSEAYKAGYKNIAEIGKERIRRAGKKIKEETGADIDYGFRVFKVDSTNMKDVYYLPDELDQNLIEKFESNIKEDRTGLDLLIQVMLEAGLELSLPIETKMINGKEVHFVAEDSLVTCFDEDIDEELIKEIAKIKPLKVVFRDNSFNSCPDRINLEEIFKSISPNTEIKVL